MKKLLLFTTALFLVLTANTYGQGCPGNLVTTNPAFGSGLSGWTQYGNTPTATVLSATSGCLNNFLALQATNNSDVGVSQPVTLKLDSCYKICYCYEFPQSGSLFNAKLVIAATNGSVTATQLLTGAFTASQAQIIDVITSTTAIPAAVQCPATFTATGNFTTLVIINQTIGVIGTDVRVDNVCLQRDVCPPSCNQANLVPGFTYTQGPGYTVNFTNTTTVAGGYTVTYSWDFGDPPSGPANTSTLQNPTHTYPGTGIYFVCLIATATDNQGLVTCTDTFCLDVIVQAVGLNELSIADFNLYPNPANNVLYFKGNATANRLMLINMYGQTVLNENVQANTLALPPTLPAGVYWAIIETNKGRALKKLVISR